MGFRDVKPHLHKVAQGAKVIADGAKSREARGSPGTSAAAASGGEAARKSLAIVLSSECLGGSTVSAFRQRGFQIRGPLPFIFTILRDPSQPGSLSLCICASEPLRTRDRAVRRNTPLPRPANP